MILLQVVVRSRMLIEEEYSNIHAAFISNGWQDFKRCKKTCLDWATMAGIYPMKWEWEMPKRQIGRICT
jgi:hypothetical protein